MINGMQNIGYQTPAPYPMMQVNNGGYPTGYPPVYPPQMGYGAVQQPMNPMFMNNGQIPMMTGYGNNVIQSNPVIQQPQQQVSSSGIDPRIESDTMPGHIDPSKALKAWEESGIPAFDPATSGLEIEFKDGTTQYIPPTAPPQKPQAIMNTEYNQGGARVSQGGYNPIDGVTTPPNATQGFNPYGGNMAAQQMMATNPSGNMMMNNMAMNMINQAQTGPVQPNQQFIGNPGYNWQNPNPVRMPNPSNFGMGFAPYSPPGVDPYAFKQPWEQQQPQYGYPRFAQGPMGVYPYQYSQGQNQFNYTLQDFLYDDQPSAIDAKAMLADVILTDEERERIGKSKPTVQGYDYFGRPIYSTQGIYYQQMQQQQQFEDARHQYQSYYTHLSKVAHAYSGEKIDEASAMKRFDPVPPPPPAPKIFNPMTATPEEIKSFNRDQFANNTNMLAEYIDYRYEQAVNYVDNYKNYLFSQVKASHDKLIGVEPGQHYDLKTYMDNGYKIGVDIAMRKAKTANRNGQTKYSQSGFRNYMNSNPMRPNQTQAPIHSSDDEYVSVEHILKGVYQKNKEQMRMYERIGAEVPEDKMYLIRHTDGKVSYSAESPAVTSQSSSQIEEILAPDASEREAHMFFLRSLMGKKEIDEAKQNLR